MEGNPARELFMKELQLGLEKEYNATGKPEKVEQVDKKKSAQEMKNRLNKYCLDNNLTLEQAIKHALESLSEARYHSPKCKDEFDYIEDVLYGILDENENEQDK